MNAIQIIETTLDYYHSMDLDDEYNYWTTSWETAYDLLERIQGLPEHSLYNAHIDSCESCRERGFWKRYVVTIDELSNVGG